MSCGLSWVNHIDAATLAASAEASLLPIGNLKDRKVQKVWRSGGSTSPYFTFDLGANKEIGVFGLFGFTLADTDTVQLRLSTVSTSGTDVLDTGVIASDVEDGYNQWVYIPESPLTARYGRVDFVATSRVALGYMDGGRAWAGPLFEPNINFSSGWGEGFSDLSIQEKARRSGATFVDALPPYRCIDASFEMINEAGRQQFLDLQRVAGRRSQVIFVPDVDGDMARGPLLGSQGDLGRLRETQLLDPRAFTVPFNIEQDL